MTVHVSGNNSPQKCSKAGPVTVWYGDSELEAARIFDQVCRTHGVPEQELNFPAVDMTELGGSDRQGLHHHVSCSR